MTVMWLFDLLAWPWVSRAQSRETQESAQGCQRPPHALRMLAQVLGAGGDGIRGGGRPMLALNKAAQDELMRTGTAFSEIARMYSEAGAAAAGSLLANPPASYRLAG
jgi:hypothetical protein